MKTILVLNQKYGKWLVLQFDRVDEKRRRRYICRCDCGVEKSVIASTVFNGRTSSCPKCKADDLTGKLIGNWTVLKRHETIAASGHSLWECECRCGKVSLVERNNLTTGGSQGCWECQRNVIVTERFPRIWYRRCIEQAKIRKIDWLICENDLWQLWEKQNHKCAITGLEIMLSKKPNEMTASLDRKDSKKGYTIDNLWFVHKHVNIMKYSFDLSYFLEMCSLISKFNSVQ